MWPRVEGMRAMELGTPGAMRDRLNALVLAGTKRATALRVQDYADDGEEMERVAERLALLDDDGARLATLEVTAVDVRRFGDVPWELAEAEGEGFTDIEDWRVRHRDFWNQHGAPVTDDTGIACIWFRVLG
ncbi:MAG: ASCH domain-containing protein [Actinomycetota bacterium]